MGEEPICGDADDAAYSDGWAFVAADGLINGSGFTPSTCAASITVSVWRSRSRCVAMIFSLLIGEQLIMSASMH